MDKPDITHTSIKRDASLLLKKLDDYANKSQLQNKYDVNTPAQSLENTSKVKDGSHHRKQTDTLENQGTITFRRRPRLDGSDYQQCYERQEKFSFQKMIVECEEIVCERNGNSLISAFQASFKSQYKEEHNVLEIGTEIWDHAIAIDLPYL